MFLNEYNRKVKVLEKRERKDFVGSNERCKLKPNLLYLVYNENQMCNRNGCKNFNGRGVRFFCNTQVRANLGKHVLFLGKERQYPNS